MSRFDMLVRDPSRGHGEIPRCASHRRFRFAALVACAVSSWAATAEAQFSAARNAPQLAKQPVASASVHGGSSALVAPPDDCATPTPIAGVGTFSFDNTGATTGTQGQSEPACMFFATTTIARDVWFDWLCPTDGTAVVALCGGTSMDSRLVAYAGSGCPTTPAIACNDDACALVSQVAFTCFAGVSYTLQLGNYPGGAPSAGSFTVSVVVPTTSCTLDDGVAENFIGLTAGGDIVWFQAFGTPGTTTIVSSISVAYGLATNGVATTLAIWDDPNEDGNPNDLVLLRTVPSNVASPFTNTFVMASVVPPVAVTGVHFLGVKLTQTSSQFPASIDQNTASLGRTWLAGGSAGTVDLANLSAASIPPTDVGTIGFSGVWLVRGDCNASTGNGYCTGAPIACPCGNGGIDQHGCASSASTSGALLAASGGPVLANDTLVLLASEMPSGSTCLFVQSASQAGGVFGDGRQCLGAPFVRLVTRPTGAGGAAAFGHGIGSDPDVHVRGGITAPGTFHYQAYYRNAAPFCTTGTFNTTNGLSIAWI